MADVLKGRDAVLDGEIVCFGDDGKPRFYELPAMGLLCVEPGY